MPEEPLPDKRSLKQFDDRIVLFVGAGPGDPELITVKGQRALMEADVVIYAGSLVPKAVLTWVSAEASVMSSSGMHLDEIIDEIEKNVRSGRRVVRLHTGDPSLYGAIFEQMAALDQRGIRYAVIPGVTAAFAAAAALGIEYTLPEMTQTLILTRLAGKTPVPESENLAELADHRASMAIYLSIAMVERVADILIKAYGAQAPCAVVYRASQPDQIIIKTSLDRLVDCVQSEKITRQAVIIIGKVLEVQPQALGVASRLYDKHFSHMYRAAEKGSNDG